MTDESYSRAIELLRAQERRVAALPGLRPGSEPIYLIHKPPARVHGTVLIFHGFGGNANSSVLQARALFDAGFNAIAVNLAGFAQQPSYWPGTTLRRSRGYARIRAALLADSRIARIIRAVTSNPASFAEGAALIGAPVMPIVRSVLQERLSAKLFKDAEVAISLMAQDARVGEAGFLKRFNDYFVSEHGRYEWEPLARLSLVQPLPGPLFMMGFSFGGPNVVNAVGRSRAVERAVLLAPYFGRQAGAAADLEHFFSLAGALDLFEFSFFGLKLKPRVSLASLIAARLATRDEITMAARESTQTLCIMAEDDFAIDVPRSKEVCQAKLGGRSLMYPARFGLGHFITPETGSKYSDAMMKVVVQFFLGEEVREQSLLKVNGAG